VIVQTAAADRDSRNVAKGLAADAAIVGENRVHERAPQLVRGATCTRGECWEQATGEQATREDPPPPDNFSVHRDALFAAGANRTYRRALSSRAWFEGQI